VQRETKDLKAQHQSFRPTVVSRRGPLARAQRWAVSLPGKLLLLTIGFVMLAEVLIFVPSIANYRVSWLNDRLRAAHIASLATDASNGGQVPAGLRRQLLMSAGVKAIAVRSKGRNSLILSARAPFVLDASFDLMPNDGRSVLERVTHKVALIRDALYVFVAPRGRLIRAYGEPVREAPDTIIDIVVEEDALHRAMLGHALNILILSIIISIITAALVYAALSRLLVRPMMRITDSMLTFSRAPEDPERIITQSGRDDEIGVAERELANMQRELAQALAQKNRLAQLGLAVSKINHDLRNMLSSAQLMSDRLGSVQDPTVQRFAPKLIASLDRAINFCNDTLKFGRAQEAAPRRDIFSVRTLAVDVGDGLDLPRASIAYDVNIPPDLNVDADREHLFRALNNLCRNALEALSAQARSNGTDFQGRITISAERGHGITTIRVSDNGPGVPERARQNLFRAFTGSTRAGGTGLGLAISHELIAAHGGSLTLVDQPEGAVFEITIPDRRVV